MSDTLNKILKARIVELFGSQARFAQTLGVPDSVVSRVVRGYDFLDPSAEKKWLSALKCDAGVLKGNREACSQS